ncbi:DUF1761 domain-containing protein [Bdellovibrio reynosensis]|uniref:DUF1761 domain-containing protein n=1 Tax=Bdellovibrio reynosensis TaxID=2835041 RepID=A0ABY4CCE3_9BACT|nr:DUF1761 domain-containing protein [Bdellovibrio reynosensis]UOF02615.1 DUF1761 domain-containing protein [Bdellovibrio reynosensis]
MEYPLITINYLAVVLAIVVSFIWGGLYYGPLMGKRWAKEMNMDFTKKPDKKVMQKSLAVNLIGTFLICYVLAHTNQVWRPSVWGHIGADGPAWSYGFWGAFFVWIGFFVPLQLNKVSWEMRSWRLVAINVAHDFVQLQLISQVLAHLR